MTDDAAGTPSDTPEEKPTEKPKSEEPPVSQIQPETVAAAPLKSEQPEPAKPKTGLAAVAEAVNATAQPSSTGEKADGEGAGLFFPNVEKIRERERARKAASDTPSATAPAETPPKPDTPNADQPEEDDEQAPEPEPAEEEVTIQRPPPPPTPEAAPPPPQPSPKHKKKKPAIGSTGIIAYMAPYTDSNGETRYRIDTYNLSTTDAQKIEWMCRYLCEVQHYIPVAHPSYLMKFMFNFLMQAIKEEFNETTQQ